MSLAARIRAHLEHGPQTSRQIADALGTTANRISMAINCMARDGMVRTDETVWPRVHTLLRHPKPVFSKEERREREKERQRLNGIAARRAQGVLPREEFNAKRKAQAEELAKIRKLAAKVAAENRKAAKAAEKAAQKAQERHKAAGRINVAITPKAPSVIELAPPKPVLMSSTEWEAMGGKIERLPSQLGQAFAGFGKGFAVKLF